MSVWTHIRGMVTVSAMLSESQADMDYQVNKTLEHLPLITGSEGNLKPYVVRKRGYNFSSTVDEYNNQSNLTNSESGRMFESQTDYVLVLHESLRDKGFAETYKEVVKWLCRLSKRIWVKDVCINIVDDYEKRGTIQDCAGAFSDAEEYMYNDKRERRFLREKRRLIKNKDFWFGKHLGNVELQKWTNFKDDNDD